MLASGTNGPLLEGRLRRLLNEAGAGIFFLDHAGRFIRVNTAMEDRLGYGSGELEHRPALDLLHPEDRNVMADMLRDMTGGKRTAGRRQLRYQMKDGTVYWGDMSLSLVLDENRQFEAVIGVVIDINAQKLAEDKLRAGEEWYRRVFEKSGAASIIVGPDMTIVMSNEEFEKLTGYAKPEIEGRMKWSEVVAPEDVEMMSRYHFARRTPGGSPPAEYHCRIVKRTGETRHIFMKVGMLPDGRCSVASFMDITALETATAALTESKARLTAIVEAAKAGIYTVNRNHTIEFMNKALMDRLGEDATGRRCFQAIYGLHHPCPWCGWETVFSGRAARREFENPEDRRWYDAMMSPIKDASGMVTGFEAVVVDITDRKQAQQALEEREASLSRENLRLKSGIRDRFRLGPMVGRSRAMQQVYEMILNAAATDANAIVYGESGTGKELAARAVHHMSERKDAAFVVVNCGAVPESLMESEFFGHRKGAFTGADRDKPGVLDQADGGTLFLDEIGELGLAMQVKLLRVIEGMGFRPVGGDRMHHPKVRIIGATHRDLTERVRAGAMREDFYYRVHVIPIHLPPLRDRKEDIPLLMEKFLQVYAIRGPVPPVTGEMLDAAHAYHWPGNVRELQNVLHRYVTLGRFEVPNALKNPKPAPPEPSPDLEAAAGHDDPKHSLAERLASYERQAIMSALAQHRWHRGKAAESLGIHRRTLFKKMKNLGIDHADNGNDRSHYPN